MAMFARLNFVEISEITSNGKFDEISVTEKAEIEKAKFCSIPQYQAKIQIVEYLNQWKQKCNSDTFLYQYLREFQNDLYQTVN